MKTVARLQLVFSKVSAQASFGFLMLAGVLSTVVAQPAIAQVTTTDPLLINPQSGDGGSDPFSGRGSGQMNGVFDLIHRATLGNSRSLAEFNQEQQQSINSEASDFRTRQLDLLRQQNSPVTPPATDAPVTDVTDPVPTANP